MRVVDVSHYRGPLDVHPKDNDYSYCKLLSSLDINYQMRQRD